MHSASNPRDSLGEPRPKLDRGERILQRRELALGGQGLTERRDLEPEFFSRAAEQQTLRVLRTGCPNVRGARPSVETQRWPTNEASRRERRGLLCADRVPLEPSHRAPAAGMRSRRHTGNRRDLDPMSTPESAVRGLHHHARRGQLMAQNFRGHGQERTGQLHQGCSARTRS